MHSFGDITFKNERNLATAVDSARLCLTEDNDPPVKVEAAIALQFLIEKQEECKTQCNLKYILYNMYYLKFFSFLFVFFLVVLFWFFVSLVLMASIC